MNILYTDQRYYSHKINLLNCYFPIFPFLSSWSCININEMLKEKAGRGGRKKEKRSSWANNNYSVATQRKIMALLHVWIFPLDFILGFAKLCANDGSPYIYIYQCTLQNWNIFLAWRLFPLSVSLYPVSFSCSLSLCAKPVRRNFSLFQGPGLVFWDQEKMSWFSELSARTTQKFLV